MDRRIHLTQREEGVMAEPGENPALHDLHPDFDLGLVSGLSSPRRNDGKAIMLCEGSVGAIDLGFIAVGSGHSRFEIIRSCFKIHASRFSNSRIILI